LTNENKEETQDLEQILERLAISTEDQQAWEDLYRKIWPWVLAILYRILRGQRELAEDASQEVFIRLLRYARFEELRVPAAFKNYVYVICQNVGKDYLRGLFSLQEYPLAADDEQASGLVARSAQPDTAALLSIRMHEILQSLNEEERRMMKMILEGRPLDEVAKSMGLSYTNAAVRLHRIRKRLSRLRQRC
jgi:RNA polymerase sigma-70 factor (ECF subfamily)